MYMIVTFLEVQQLSKISDLQNSGIWRFSKLGISFTSVPGTWGFILPPNVNPRIRPLGIDLTLNRPRELIDFPQCANTYIEMWTQKKVSMPDLKKHLTLFSLANMAI